MPSLQDAYDSVIAACNDPYIGYSQTSRRTITLGVNYRTYCDCSSLMSWALTRGGFFTSNPWFATSGELSALQSVGFQIVSKSGEWLPGDILLRPKTSSRGGHTEMVYSGGTGRGVTMGAHWAKPVFADQVSINSSSTTGQEYTYLLRYDGVSPPDPGGGGDPDDPGDPGGYPAPIGAIIEELRRRLWYPGRH